MFKLHTKMSAVVLEVLNARSKILSLYNRTEESVIQDVEKVKEWIRKQPHIPDVPEDRVIERFLVASKFHYEEVKSKLNVYYAVRTLIPELQNYEPCGPRAKKLNDTLYLVPLPKPTVEFSRITCMKLKDTNVENFDILDTFAHLINIVEIRLREDYSYSEIYIYDMQGVTVGHIAKISPTFLRKMNYLMENLFKVKIEAVHIVNAPSFIESIISLFSRYFKEKIMRRVNTHNSFEALHKSVPKNCLPEDFGGTLKSLEEYQKNWQEKFIQYTPVYEHLNTMKINEDLRTKLPENDILGISGNFRQLGID